MVCISPGHEPARRRSGPGRCTPVDRHDGRISIRTAGQVERGAQRGGAGDVPDVGDLVVTQQATAHHQARMRTQVAAEEGDLGRRATAGRALGVEQRRGGVARQHTAVLHEPVRRQRPQQQTGRLGGGPTVDVGQQPQEPRPPQAIRRDQPGRDRVRAPEGRGPARHAHAARMPGAKIVRGRSGEPDREMHRSGVSCAGTPLMGISRVTEARRPRGSRSTRPSAGGCSG